MLGTIVIGSCVSVQGEIVRYHRDGRMSVRVGNLTFTGRAVNAGEENAPRKPTVVTPRRASVA